MTRRACLEVLDILTTDKNVGMTKLEILVALEAKGVKLSRSHLDGEVLRLIANGYVGRAHRGPDNPTDKKAGTHWYYRTGKEYKPEEKLSRGNVGSGYETKATEFLYNQELGGFLYGTRPRS